MIHKQDWRDFARHWTASIGFLHLDAEHTRNEVVDQIGAFLSYMASGSIMAGDDYNCGAAYARLAQIAHFHAEQKVKCRYGRTNFWWVEVQSEEV